MARLSELLVSGLRRLRPAAPALVRGTPPSLPDDAASAGTDSTPAAPTPAPITSSGVVVKDYDVSAEYPGAVRRAVANLPVDRSIPAGEVVLNVFEAKRVALTTIYLPIDLVHHRLLINQSYEGVLQFWRCRPQIADGRYTFQAPSPKVIERKTVVIGGPIDSNYYHWMLNWVPRIAILKMLRPDILADPEVAFLMAWQAEASPFIDFLRAIGLGEDRLIWADHENDYLLEHAVLVSFGNQHAFNPEVIAATREMFAPMGERAPRASRPRLLWISRQGLGPNRRRIENIEEVRSLFDIYGLQEVTLEGMAVGEQIALFQDAEFIASVHGAGLTNIMFCAPGTKVLSLDSRAHIRFGAALLYETLAGVCGLSYRSMTVKRAPRPPGVERNMANLHNQDLIVPVDRLDGALREMLGS